MTTLSVYCGWTLIDPEQIPREIYYQGDIDGPRYMGGFRIIYPDVFDQTCACDTVLFSTSEEALDFATNQAQAFLELLEVFGIIEPQEEVAWETISPPN